MINMIAAISLSGQLGYNNQLLCKLPSDMKRFRQLTENNFCIFGRKTFESIGRPLPNRHNIILTHNSKYQAPIGTYVYPALEDVLYEYENYNEGENELFICGGSQIYEQALPFTQRIYLTIIGHVFSHADSYFPVFNTEDWEVTENIKEYADKDNPYVHCFITYQRKNK